MKKWLKASLGLTVAGILFFIIFTNPFQEKASDKIKIGSPDDAGGLIVYYLLNTKGFNDAELSNSSNLDNYYDTFSLKDCCSTTSSWALSSESVDLAVMCPDAARELIEKDKRFKILGPVLVNSNIILEASTTAGIKKIGMMQNRSYQHALLRAIYGEDYSAISMVKSALPYAYERKAVDGIVMDIIKGTKMEGLKRGNEGEKDIVTYVLVAKRDFMNSALSKSFLIAWNEAVKDLNSIAILQEALKSYTGKQYTREEVELWNRFETRFVSIAETDKE